MSETKTLMFDPPSPELIDCDGQVWTRLYPRPGHVAVPLNSEHLAALADYERHKGGYVAPIFEFMLHEANTGETQRVTPRIRVVTHGADDGVDRLGRQWAMIPPMAGTAPALITDDEAKLLADHYRRCASKARSEDRTDEATTFATRALQFRSMAHAISPDRNLRDGHPRFPDMTGSA